MRNLTGNYRFTTKNVRTGLFKKEIKVILIVEEIVQETENAGNQIDVRSVNKWRDMTPNDVVELAFMGKLKINEL